MPRPVPPTLVTAIPEDPGLSAAIAELYMHVIEENTHVGERVPDDWARAADRVAGSGFDVELNVRRDVHALNVSTPLPSIAFACSQYSCMQCVVAEKLRQKLSSDLHSLPCLALQTLLDRVRPHIPARELENAKVLLLLLPQQFVLSNGTDLESFPEFEESVAHAQYRTYIRLVC